MRLCGIHRIHHHRLRQLVCLISDKIAWGPQPMPRYLGHLLYHTAVEWTIFVLKTNCWKQLSGETCSYGQDQNIKREDQVKGVERLVAKAGREPGSSIVNLVVPSVVLLLTTTSTLKFLPHGPSS